MPARRLSTAEERALVARIQVDPGYQQVAHASYPSPMLRDQAINEYLTNDPRSPMHGVNTQQTANRGVGAYRFDPASGQLRWTSTSPSSYVTDPGGIGRDAVIAAATAGTLSGMGGGASATSAGGGSSVAGAGGVPSLPWTLGASSYGAAAPTTGAGTMAAGGGGGLFSTLGRFFGSPGGAQVIDAAGGLAGNWMQNRSANRAADIQGQYNTQALDFLKSQDARDYAEYLKERERLWGQQDEDRRFTVEDRARAEEMRQLALLRDREREGRLTPFRQGAERGYQTLSSLLFDPNQAMAQPAPMPRRQLADLVR